MPFRPGQSGNPKGREPKGRALTEILQSALDEEFGADKVALKTIMARKISQAIATGVLEFPGNGKRIRRLKLNQENWLQLLKFIYSHIDGPARMDLNVNANMNTTAVNFYIPDNGRGDALPAEDLPDNE